ncbi:MAG: UxaA family hydrolase [Actinomycetota bacterium]|nr:UxaA family hydrolase [Actinomycetota bacterium]
MSTPPRALRLDPQDNVAVVIEALAPGDEVVLEPARVVAREAIGFGHKIALAPIPAGTPVRKYGEVIGIATADIAAGAHVHVHNVVSARLPGVQAAGR